MTPTAITPTNFAAEPSSSSAANLKDAASKFEALLIAQMLKSARETDSGGWSGEGDQSNSSIMEMSEQLLAELLGAQGCLGIAKMVVKEVGKEAKATSQPQERTSAKAL